MNEFWLDSPHTLAGGRDLATAGENLRGLRASSGAEAAAMSDAQPWGTDSIGHAFERNYRPVEDQFLQLWEALAARVEDLGDAVVTAVREATRTDLQASMSVRQTYRERP
ncbi:hypothetical protein [Actinoplanes sp. NPDC051494]|uniref:hypothetical protein n=1 Tax=Actinoplanes sp. NPDC051494 TaxID=3363907 RepID=UPI0037A6FB11